MTSSATIVTALYDIGRDKLTGKNAHRSFTKYLDWFKNLLSINAPMVIFISEDLHSYVLEHRRPEYSTTIIIRSFEQLAAYKYHDRIQSTIDSMTKEPNADGSLPNYFKECPEFITARYETVIYSKFDFLKEVASDNPYNTDYFIWLDAGTFYQQAPFDCTLSWPDPYKIQLLGDRFLVSDYKFNLDDKSPIKDASSKKSYLRLNRNEICAFTLGGTKKAIDTVHANFWHEVENALQLGVINNEQHILQLMVLEHPEHYYIWYRTRYQYPKLPVPLRDRMIPTELAQGTFTGEHYGINPNVKLLTVATREVPSSSYERWETTARHYGYNYDIIGRNESWKGFGTKTKLYHERLQTVTEPYTILTDCLDLFFVGSSSEIYDKFIHSGKDIIIGGEPQIWYVNGKYNKQEMKDFFHSFANGEFQVYPNSGFIMGKTEVVKRLVEMNVDHPDDQAACFEVIYENKLPLAIDYKTALVANVPNYKQDYDKVLNNFVFDDKLKRYRNIHSDELPVVLHFPGKNLQIMQQFYMISQPDLAIQSNTTTNSGWIIIGIIIILIIIAIILFVQNNSRS